MPAALFTVIRLFQMPERSGRPSALRGAGLDSARSGLSTWALAGIGELNSAQAATQLDTSLNASRINAPPPARQGAIAAGVSVAIDSPSCYLLKCASAAAPASQFTPSNGMIFSCLGCGLRQRTFTEYPSGFERGT